MSSYTFYINSFQNGMSMLDNNAKQLNILVLISIGGGGWEGCGILI